MQLPENCRFGAQYYNPENLLWLSGDPMVVGDTGFLNKVENLPIYGYGAWNPNGLVDENGEFLISGTITVVVLAYRAYSAYDTYKDVRGTVGHIVEGRYGEAATDAAYVGVGIVAGKLGKSALQKANAFRKTGAGKQLLAKAKGFFKKENLSTSIKKIENPKFKRRLSRMYDPNGVIGDKSTADVLKFELDSGIPFKTPSGHVQKGFEGITGLEKSLRSGNLNPYDKKITIQELNKLKNIMGQSGSFKK